MRRSQKVTCWQPEDLGLISRTYMVEEEKQFQKFVLWLPPVVYGIGLKQHHKEERHDRNYYFLINNYSWLLLKYIHSSELSRKRQFVIKIVVLYDQMIKLPIQQKRESSNIKMSTSQMLIYNRKSEKVYKNGTLFKD